MSSSTNNNIFNTHFISFILIQKKRSWDRLYEVKERDFNEDSVKLVGVIFESLPISFDMALAAETLNWALIYWCTLRRLLLSTLCRRQSARTARPPSSSNTVTGIGSLGDICGAARGFGGGRRGGGPRLMGERCGGEGFLLYEVVGVGVVRVLMAKFVEGGVWGGVLVVDEVWGVRCVLDGVLKLMAFNDGVFDSIFDSLFNIHFETSSDTITHHDLLHDKGIEVLWNQSCVLELPGRVQLICLLRYKLPRLHAWRPIRRHFLICSFTLSLDHYISTVSRRRKSRLLYLWLVRWFLPLNLLHLFFFQLFLDFACLVIQLLNLF